MLEIVELTFWLIVFQKMHVRLKLMAMRIDLMTTELEVMEMQRSLAQGTSMETSHH